MSVNLSPVGGAGAQFCDNNGNPLNGGKLYTYSAGTTTPAATYTSAAGSVFHTNPIILNAGGRVPDSGEIWLSDNISYKFVLKTSADVLIATWDNINGINSNFVNYTVQEEVITATADQTVFNLSTITYAPATNSLSVYVDGVNQIITEAYVETDANTVTFVSGLHVGAQVKFTTAVPATGTATSADVVTYDPAGTGAVATTVQAKLRESVSVKDFGAVGDDSDETAELTHALAAAAGNTLWFEPGKVYRSTSALVVPADTTLELNGSTIKFVVTGSANCLELRSGVTVRNGTVELAGSSYSGHGGNGCPIIIGDYGPGVGYNNVLVDGVNITSNKDGGNAFVITGDSSNIVFQNINITGPNALIGYGCHWGNANDPTAGTTHPHNITMRNIVMGTTTYSTALGLFVSGCYDIKADNLIFENSPQGCVYVFCGDYGLEFAADSNIKVHGIHNIKISNVTGKRVGYPIQVDMFKNESPATPEKEVCDNVVFENCSFYGNAPTTSTKYGFRLRYTDNVELRQCRFDNFYHAGVTSLSSLNNTFTNCIFENSYKQAIVSFVTGETSSTPSNQNTFVNCSFKGSNQSSAVSVPDIYIKWADQWVIDGCKFDSSLVAYNIRCEGGADSSFANIVTNNLVVTAPTTTCFSFGASTDYRICDLFVGNRMLNPSLVPSGGFTSGQLHIPFALTPHTGANRPAMKMVGAAVPTGGSWFVGDTVYFDSPTAAGKIGTVCVTAGTPGAWKPFGSIDA